MIGEHDFASMMDGYTETFKDHDRPDLAQEFLQRCPDYRQDHARLQAIERIDPERALFERRVIAHRWGLEDMFEPDLSVRSSPAIWQPAWASDVVVLRFGRPRLGALPAGARILVELGREGEHHFVVACGAARFRLCLRVGHEMLDEAYEITLGPSAAVRLASAVRFERFRRGCGGVPGRPAVPTPSHRRRLVQLLAIHDAVAAGAPLRDITYAWLFPRHAPLTGASWSSSNERRTAYRRIAQARRYTRFGYRGLLRGF